MVGYISTDPNAGLTLAQIVRRKHPGAYDDLSDADLDARVRTKYAGAYDDIPRSGVDLKAYLKKTPTTNAQRAALWDAYEGSANEDELASKIQSLQIPKQVKAQLWDMKAASGRHFDLDAALAARGSGPGDHFDLDAALADQVSPRVDYDKLAAQHGGASSQVDYDALAAKFGGRYISTDPNAGMPPQPPPGFVLDAPPQPPPGFVLDSEPSSVPDSLAEKLKPQGSAGSRFLSGAWKQLNPVTMAKAAGQAIAHPIDTASGLIDAQTTQAVRAYDALKEGKLGEAAYRAQMAQTPLLGPMAADITDRGQATGDVAGMFGEIAGIAAAPKVGGAAVKTGVRAANVARASVPVAGDVLSALKAVASNPTTQVLTSGATSVGATLGGPAGAAIAGVSVGALRAAPEVFKAVKEGLMRRRPISGARAESALMRMGPEELAATVDEIVPAAAKKFANANLERADKAGIDLLPMNPKLTAAQSQTAQILAWKGAGMNPTEIANAMAKIYKSPAEYNIKAVRRALRAAEPKAPEVATRPKAPESAPAPVSAPAPTSPAIDSWSKPLKPAPEAPASVKGAPGDNARAWIQKYAAADIEGRRALVKGLSGKMTYEDMRQLAAYTDDMTDSPAAPPAAVESHFRPAKLDHIQRGKEHLGHRSPPFVEERLKYLQEQAAKRGDAPEAFKAKAAANKDLGAELKALLEDSKPTARQQGAALLEKAKSRSKKGGAQ